VVGCWAMSVTDDEHTRALEEQWIEGDLTHETAQSEHFPPFPFLRGPKQSVDLFLTFPLPLAAVEGIYTSILTGLLVGFLYPILPWFFFREIPAPNFFDPLEVEPDRLPPSSGSSYGASAREVNSEALEETLDWSMGIIPGAGGRSTGGGTTGTGTGGTGTTRGASEVAPGNPGQRGLFGLRGRAGGEWITGVVFGQRVQVSFGLFSYGFQRER
jgi:hypothetical protein